MCTACVPIVGTELAFIAFWYSLFSVACLMFTLTHIVALSHSHSPSLYLSKHMLLSFLFYIIYNRVHIKWIWVKRFLLSEKTVSCNIHVHWFIHVYIQTVLSFQRNNFMWWFLRFLIFITFGEGNFRFLLCWAIVSICARHYTCVWYYLLCLCLSLSLSLCMVVFAVVSHLTCCIEYTIISMCRRKTNTLNACASTQSFLMIYLYSVYLLLVDIMISYIIFNCMARCERKVNWSWNWKRLNILASNFARFLEMV